MMDVGIYNMIVNNHLENLHRKSENAQHITVVINAFGGPGAGKTTASLGITEELKKLGYVAEYVSEYAKELVWDENWNLLDGSAANQMVILKEQMKRMDRLMGKVDFIVTDAPILLNQIYNKELSPEYEEMLQKLSGQYENFNFVVQRDLREFETEGRIHNRQESEQKDKEITAMLDRYNIYYGIYNHSSVNKVIANAVKTHNRVKKERAPIYLEIPHIADRKAFRRLAENMKANGARYDTQNNRWYILPQTNQEPFRDFLPKKERKSVMDKLHHKKELTGRGKENENQVQNEKGNQKWERYNSIER